MSEKRGKTKRRVPETTFEVSHFFEFTDTVEETESPPVPDSVLNHHHENPPRKSAGAKTGSVSSEDRRRLKDLEILLNNCLNLAKSLRAKKAPKIVELLCAARTQVQKVRSNDS